VCLIKHIKILRLFTDDASTDNSNQVFAKFVGDKRICTTYYNRSTVAVPLSNGTKRMREAKGEYVWIAESDYADERLLAELVTRLDKTQR